MVQDFCLSAFHTAGSFRAPADLIVEDELGCFQAMMGFMISVQNLCFCCKTN